MRLSVILVTCGRENLFRRTMTTARASLPLDSEIVVIVNGNLPNTLNWLHGLSDPRIQIHSVQRENRCQARNRAIGLSTGDIIHVLDDDVIVPEGLFERVLKQFEDSQNLGVLGGPNLTPEQSPWKSKLFGAVMQSPFAAPKVNFRYGGGRNSRFKASEHHLILCNLAFRRSVFLNTRGFWPEMTSNEENLLLHQLGEIGTNIEFDRTLGVFHERRPTFGTFMSQIFSYGVGRAQQTRIAPKSLSVQFLIPTFAVITTPFLLFKVPEMWCLLVGLHSAMSFISARKVEDLKQLGALSIFLSIPLTLAVHAAYGFGFIVGLLRMLTATPLSFVHSKYTLAFRVR